MKHRSKKSTSSPAGRFGPPTVQLVGRTDHPDFRDALALLRSHANIDPIDRSLEMIVIAQERPGAVAQEQVEELQRAAPLAGIVLIAGSWCEGELRTGRPLAGVTRLYWYEFPAWWRRQIERRAQGLCPEWGGASECGTKKGAAGNCGLVVVSTPWWESFDAISDELKAAGYATVWQKPGRTFVTARGVVAGVWEGGQLDEREAESLSTFCSQLGSHGASVVALLDFPRRECHELAIEAGASAVLGKPWDNDAIVETLRWSIAHQGTVGHASQSRAA